MQQRSSTTISEAAPKNVFSSASESKSSGTSISSGESAGTDEPPGITAFSCRPSAMPPACS
jgi:hypothetical protein